LDEVVGFAQHFFDRTPARARVETHSHPAALAHVRRHEEALRVGVDEGLLCSQRHGQPDAHVRGAVMVIVELGEHPATHPERRLAVGDLLRGPGQGQAKSPQPIQLRRYGVT
jgi:hypothetical protein